jgi:hypothetical protein
LISESLFTSELLSKFQTLYGTHIITIRHTHYNTTWHTKHNTWHTT